MTAFTAVTLSAQCLNVGTYNIRQINKRDYTHDDGWYQRIDQLCDVIKYCDFDIFGAQEVFNIQLQDLLKRLPDYDYVGVGRDDGDTKGEYSPVFYNKNRFKCLKSGTFWISETPDTVSIGWDAACKRICTWGQFKDRKTGKKIWFFTLHMDHIGKVSREEGARLVLRKINELAGPKAHVILTGDFNVLHTTEVYDIIANCGFLKDSYVAAPVKLAPNGTFCAFDPANMTEARIDHVWVSNSAEVERYGILTFNYWKDTDAEPVLLDNAPQNLYARKGIVHFPSDHFPVQVFLKF